MFPLVSILIGRGIPQTEIDPEVRHELPEDYPALLEMEKIDELFGGSEMVLVVLQTDDIVNSDTLLRSERRGSQGGHRRDPAG